MGPTPLRAWKVLPNGCAVRLIQASESSSYIVEAARAATGVPDPADSARDISLQARLMQDKHTSPFEFVFCHVQVVMPVWMRAQLVRHRTLSYAEFSKRYSDKEVVEERPFFTPNQVRKQSEGMNKQAGAGSVDEATHNWFIDTLTRLSVTANKLYQQAVDAGIERGQARFLLGQNQMTSIHVAGNLKNWVDYLALRHHADAQVEHREVAEAIADLLAERYPDVFAMAERFRFNNLDLSEVEADLVATTLHFAGVSPDELEAGLTKAISQNNIAWFSKGEAGRALKKLRDLFGV